MNTELTEQENVSMANELVATSNEVPDYLKDEKISGIEGLDQSDFKIPRIKLLQALSPEVTSFPGVAKINEFWHTGANRSLGPSFKMVVANASKRVILWAPRNMGGGLLAYSADGKYWTSGANAEFQIQVKGRKAPIVWKTLKNVQQSGLLNWGSSDPEDEKSGPAATLVYEYMCYLPDTPDLSPCILGCYRTGIANAKKLNTSLLMTRRPIQAIAVKCEAVAQNEAGNTWSVPDFTLAGYVNKQEFDIVRDISNRYSEYKPDYENNTVIDAAEEKVVDDKIPF